MRWAVTHSCGSLNKAPFGLGSLSTLKAPRPARSPEVCEHCRGGGLEIGVGSL